MKLRFLILWVFAFCMLSSCDDDASENNSAEFMDSVTSSIDTENALRANVLMNFKSSSSFYIEYWEEGDVESILRTKEREASGETKQTLIFLKEETTYNFCVNIKQGEKYVKSDVYSFTTKSLPDEVSSFIMIEDETTEKIPGYLLCVCKRTDTLSLLDTEGNVVWYQIFNDTDLRVSSFDPIHQTFQCIVGTNANRNVGNGIAVMDLYGNILFHKDFPDLYPHHDVKRMPDGNIIFVGNVPQTFDLTSQGGGSEDVVWGDGVNIINMKGEIVWQWNCFEVMDPTKELNLEENPNNNPCKDWLHANSSSFDSNGDIYVTFNWLSQLWKIDRKTKKLIYRLGKNGDINIPESSYMSGIHDSHPVNPDNVMVFDNGLRKTISRVLTFNIDAINKTAEVTTNVDIPESYKTPYQGGASIISDDLLVTSLTQSFAIIFSDKKGTIRRILKTSYQAYRADYIKPFDY